MVNAAIALIVQTIASPNVVNNTEATVELPPGELDRLRMNQQEMTQAAEATQGRFYTLATADNLLDDLPAGYRVSLSTPHGAPPFCAACSTPRVRVWLPGPHRPEQSENADHSATAHATGS